MTNRKAEWTQTYPKKKWTQGDKTNSNKPELPSQVPLFNAEEIYSALEVIRKVMKTDAAQPFNGPVDPIALGIPDYFEVIDKPMDFGTICKNLENGVKYKNSKDVLNDVQYIWVNCSKYYKKGHYLLELMKRMRNKFNEYWTEAGLFIEQPQEMDDSAILERMEQTLRGSTHVQWGSVGPYQRQDQMNHSRPQPHQPQPQNPPMQRPYQGSMSSSTHQTPHPHGDENGRCADGLGDVHLGFSNITNTEPGRCHRTDGKKWRCSRDVCPDQKYCERHMNRGRRRSRMSVEEFVLSPPLVGSMMRCGNHEPSSIIFQPHQLPEALLTRVQLTSSQPQPSHIQICSDEEEEHLCSPSRMSSSLRCSKHAPKLHEGQMNAIDKYDDMLASSKIVSPQPLSSFGQPHQTPGGTLQVQLSSSQPQPPHPQPGIDKEEEHSHSTPVVGPLNATDNHLDQVLPSQIVHLEPSSNNGVPPQHPEGISQFHFGQPSRPRAGIDDGRVDVVRLVKEKAPRHTCSLNPQRKHNKKWHQSQLCVQTPPQQEASQSLAIESNEFTQIMGQDSSPPDLDVPSQTEAEALKMVSTANAEIKEMKEKLASTEQTCAQMATQMATMMSIISNMQKKLSDKDCVPPVPSQAADVSNDSCEHQTEFVHGISPNQAADVSNDSGLPSASV